MAKGFGQARRSRRIVISLDRRRRYEGRGGQRLVITAALMAVAMLCGLAASARAGDAGGQTRETFEKWLRQNQNAKPDFKPGDVLTAKDLDRMRPFVPPGYLEQLNFPEFRAEIIAPRSHQPRKDYMACSEKYQAQVQLAADGTAANYVCGQPFANSSIREDDPLSGARAVQNFDARWLNYGQVVMDSIYIWERFGGSHAGQLPVAEAPPEDWTNGIAFFTKFPKNIAAQFGGGGVFERKAGGFYERMYLSHLAQRADHGGLFDVPDAKTYYWKEFDGLFSPFDLRGTVVIDYRYADQNRADDAWTYDPKLRRVRRISVEVKSDSVAGTELTYEDFYTFSGRSVRWNFKFLGWKDMLAVLDSKYDSPHLYGPNGFVPNDAWSVRRFAVVERTPKEPHHPYSSAVMFWDAENWHPWMMLAYDRDHKLMKVSMFHQRWSEDFRDWAEVNHGVESTVPIGVYVLDLQKQRATLFSNVGSCYPSVTVDRIKRFFDLSKLEEAHR
ncbi:MAG: DUF1329 domain-containing protein [Candidatus Binataceae bacterium]|jgi:hypothetical protein